MASAASPVPTSNTKAVMADFCWVDKCEMELRSKTNEGTAANARWKG